MPADGLALAIRVGGQEDGLALFGGGLQVVDDVLFALDGAVIGGKIAVHVHAQRALGQVAEVAHAGLDHIIRP